MAANVGFPGHAPSKGFHSKAMASLALGSAPFKKTCQLDRNKVKMQQQGIFTGTRTNYKLFSRRKVHLVMSSMSNSESSSSPLSSSEAIKEFYACINKKNLKQLREFISNDCSFDDFSFPKPFEGKKEVMHFLEQLVTSMGQNLKFRVGHVCEGDEFTAGVNWHLEWKELQVPLTRGCSFYECSKEGERLLIKKAQVVIESPIKLGFIALALLMTVTSLFDDFPKVTEGFLKSPETILLALIKVYSIFLAPFINPLLAFYAKVWNFMTRLLGYAIKLLLLISRIFLKLRTLIKALWKDDVN